MLTQHCTLGYHQSGTLTLETFAIQVANGIYTNPAIFTDPVIKQIEFEALQQKFNAAASDYATFGSTKKTIFSNARKALIDALDLIADYVDAVALGDESVIVLSGFVPSSAVAQSNIPIQQISTFFVKRTAVMGEIAVEIPAITGHGTVNYFCICSEGSPLTSPVIADGQLLLDATSNKVRYDFAKSRKKVFRGLTPGVYYYFYVFACNTVSVSPLSDVKNCMAA